MWISRVVTNSGKISALTLAVICLSLILTTVPRSEAETTVPDVKASPYRTVGKPDSAQRYYQSVWGIDNLLVRQTASGSLIRFSYRVTHPERAKPIGDDRATPYLYGQRSHALLTIPVMEKVGPLRQSRQAKAGKEYWMTFSNKGHLVQAGDRVDVIIGAFHAVGLMVE